MLKKAALAVFGLVLALSFSAPKAQAEVHVGVAVAAPGVYGAVAVQPVHYDAYQTYGYYDNGQYGYGDSGQYAYYNTNPYAYNGTYYDSGRSYYAPAYGGHWRDRDYWRHRRECRDNRYEREHERWHERHDRDRW